MNRKWTVQITEIAHSLRLNFPKQEREFKVSFYMHTGGGNPNQMLQTPRNLFTKDGKFFYTLIPNLSSIKS